jgi:hypothetical protein
MDIADKLYCENFIKCDFVCNTFSLFYTIWSNPLTTAYNVVWYIFRMADSSSPTWAAHLPLLCQMYGISEPLFLIKQEKAAHISMMEYLNVQRLSRIDSAVKKS